MIDVNSTAINVEVKKPSTINFIMLLMLCLKIAKIITPGTINKDGRTNIALNSGGVFVRHEVK